MDLNTGTRDYISKNDNDDDGTKNRNNCKDMEELFNKLYDYEPDEQSYDIINMLWSVENYLHTSWCDFYERYGKKR
jgi:hypothetical protein